MRRTYGYFDEITEIERLRRQRLWELQEWRKRANRRPDRSLAVQPKRPQARI